jgi:hypothetical protein
MIEAVSQRVLDAQKINRAQNMGRLKHNSFKTILRDLEVENELEEGYFDDHVEAIKSRVYRGKKASGLGNSQTSPLSELEPLLVDYCIKLSEIGQPLTKAHVMALVASMIDDQELEKKVIAWKKKHCSYKEGQPLVGDGWYRRFVRRNDDKLRRTKALVRDINRQTWVTYDNFESMYECVYDRMVQAGIAKRLPEKVWRDREGLIVDSEENAFGKATEYEITHPHMLLTVDETGSNTNQKLDGHVGGELFLVGAYQKEVGTLGSATDIHFTVMVFTSGTGHAVMVAVILKSEKTLNEIPTNWVMGLDWLKIKGCNSMSDAELLDQSRDAQCGGPTCTYNGKEVKCYVNTSPKASITSAMLADMLSRIDIAGVFPREQDGPKPFLLLDGHHSRFEIPFLNYIHDSQHEWVVCIGVPYGTHIWQVADSSEMNGAFKLGVTKAKKAYFNVKPVSCQTWSTTDIIPIINHAFPDSFGQVDKAKKAICDRGWGPLNYKLLQHPEVLKTKLASPPVLNQENEPFIRMPRLPPLSGADTGTSLTINVTKGAAGEATAAIVRSELLREGSINARKKRHDREDNLASVAQRLAKITKVSSGTIASQGIYHLGADIHTKVMQHHAEKEATEAEAVKKRAEREDVRRGKAQSTWDKRRNGTRNKTTLTDLRILVQDLKEGSDSPLKKDRTGLECQCKARELRAVRLKQARGDVLSHYDLRILLEAGEGNTTTTEEAYLSRSTGELEAELQNAALVGTNNLPRYEDGVSGPV